MIPCNWPVYPYSNLNAKRTLFIFVITTHIHPALTSSSLLPNEVFCDRIHVVQRYTVNRCKCVLYSVPNVCRTLVVLTDSLSLVLQILTIAESFMPQLIPAQWPVGSIPLWAGLLEGVLLPIILAMTDKAFCRRVATIYSRRRPSDMTKPPQGIFYNKVLIYV